MRVGDRISTRFLLAALVVAGLALLIVALGVLRVGADAFQALMMAAGESAEHAHQMFDASVSGVLAVAGLVAAAMAAVLAMVLARRLARPIERLAEGAARIADGDLDARVAEDGPAELRALAAAYNRMAERLAEQEAVRREFIVNASHELRTPLTNLQGYLEALRDGVIAPAPEVFDSLREEVDRLTRLAASLDVLAEAGSPGAGPGGGIAGTGPAETRVLDLGGAVRTAVDLVAPALARRAVAIELFAPDGVPVRARPDELTQVLANLLQNALRYTPREGRVRVIVDHDGELGRVRVANTGPGIPEADLPRVWERFHRVEKSRDRARGGAGIGLAIVKQLVEAAGGRVGVASEEDGWTEFTVLLPG
jgi:signal transduction histidine kinase